MPFLPVWNQVGKLKGYMPLYSILGAQVGPASETELLVLHDSTVLRCQASCTEERDSWISAINKTCIRTKPQCSCFRVEVACFRILERCALWVPYTFDNSYFD